MPASVKLNKPLRGVAAAAVANLGAAEPRVPSAAAPETDAAYERGRRDGETAVRDQLSAQRNEFLELQRGVLESLRQAVPQVVRDAETALIALALEAAQKLVAGLPVTTEMVEAAVREALARVEDNTEITVLLHPDDLALLAPPADGKLHYRPSPDVTRGGCLVHTRFGVIDARRETKHELLKRSLAP